MVLEVNLTLVLHTMIMCVHGHVFSHSLSTVLLIRAQSVQTSLWRCTAPVHSWNIPEQSNFPDDRICLNEQAKLNCSLCDPSKFINGVLMIIHLKLAVRLLHCADITEW